MMWPFRRRADPAIEAIDLDPPRSGLNWRLLDDPAYVKSGGRAHSHSDQKFDERELQPWAVHIAAMILAEVKLEEVH